MKTGADPRVIRIFGLWWVSLALNASAVDVAIAPAGNGVVITWPAGGTNEFYVQASSSLSKPDAWRITTNTIFLDGTNYFIMDGTIADSRFYRLQAWEILFDGTSVSAFRGYQQTSFPSSSYWVVTNGELQTVPGTGGNPPSIITTNLYSDFELWWEWKVPSGGNSGVNYRCTEEYPNPEWSGPEFQLTYDADLLTPAKRRIGAVWDLIAPTNRVVVPAGQWNQCRLLVQSNYVEHWLNSNRVVAYYLNSAPFTNIVATNSTFSQYPNFANARTGYIAFREEGSVTSFRNIKIRRLPPQ